MFESVPLTLPHERVALTLAEANRMQANRAILPGLRLALVHSQFRREISVRGRYPFGVAPLILVAVTCGLGVTASMEIISALVLRSGHLSPGAS